VLNLLAEKHAHGLRGLAAVEATRGSCTGAAAAVQRATGVTVGTRQLQALAAATAVDFDACSAERCAPTAEAGEVLVLSADGKGVVMRPDALRPATAKAAQGARTKLATRLPKGEKGNHKRMEDSPPSTT